MSCEICGREECTRFDEITNIAKERARQIIINVIDALDCCGYDDEDDRDLVPVEDVLQAIKYADL